MENFRFYIDYNLSSNQGTITIKEGETINCTFPIIRLQKWVEKYRSDLITDYLASEDESLIYWDDLFKQLNDKDILEFFNQ